MTFMRWFLAMVAICFLLIIGKVSADPTMDDYSNPVPDPPGGFSTETPAPPEDLSRPVPYPTTAQNPGYNPGQPGSEVPTSPGSDEIPPAAVPPPILIPGAPPSPASNPVEPPPRATPTPAPPTVHPRIQQDSGGYHNRTPQWPTTAPPAQPAQPSGPVVTDDQIERAFNNWWKSRKGLSPAAKREQLKLLVEQGLLPPKATKLPPDQPASELFYYQLFASSLKRQHLSFEAVHQRFSTVDDKLTDILGGVTSIDNKLGTPPKGETVVSLLLKKPGATSPESVITMWIVIGWSAVALLFFIRRKVRDLLLFLLSKRRPGRP